jgi:glycerol uptake facilitator-like aquaporin
MIVSRAFEGLALYLTAPIVGAIVAAVAYRYLVLDGEAD